MPCYHPLTAWRARYTNPSGKRPLVFKRRDGIPNTETQVGCGRCIGCRLEYSRQWAIRCMHENQMHDWSSFITLTYDDEHLPFGGTLYPKHLTDFWKRLRAKLGIKLLYFACGEYGEKLERPHYHACIFGWDFPDRYHWRTSHGHPLYRSDTLEALWTFGNSEIGEVTFESAAYVARYVTKKVNGDRAQSHYERVDLETGEVFSLLPEFTRMSLKPAIGKTWLEKFGSEVYPSDEVVVNGKQVKPPRYYDGLLERRDPELYGVLKESRLSAAKESPDNTPERLRVREKVKEAQLATMSNLSRNLGE